MLRPDRRLSMLFVATLLLGLVLPATAETGGRYRLQVNGISCPFCSYGIEKKLGAMEGVEEVTVLLDEGAVIVHTRPGTELTETSARKAVEDAGFGLQGFEEMAPAADSPDREKQGS